MYIETVREIMTEAPQCCGPDDPAVKAARLMARGDFGVVPVVEPATGRLLGMITDRDITCRLVAAGRDPNRTPVRDGMSREVVTLLPDASIHECIRLMEIWQVRRIPIVDRQGRVLGIVAQADLARTTLREHELEHELAEMTEEVAIQRETLPFG